MSLTALIASHVLPLIDQPAPVAPPGAAKITTMLSWGMWLVIACAVLGLMITGVMMFLAYSQGRPAEHMSRLGYVMAGMVIAGAAAALVNAVVL